nr:LysR family transcriptional regulator [Bradyrhizobium sp. 6(2017)]
MEAELPDSIGDIELFCGVVEAGGISAGAAALRSSPPATSRRLAALEARLGVKLAERNARRFRLTEEGALFYEHCRKLLAAMRDVEAEVSARGATARGLLKVGAPMELGRRRIAPLLAEFADQHPGLDVHLVLSDAGLEVGQDGIDVALRVDRPDNPALMTRKIATTPRVLCAAPSYFAKRGMPERPADLIDHECLRLARRHHLHDRWRFRTEHGVEEIVVKGHLSSSSGDVLHGWALEGRGLSSEALWDVSEDLQAGRLVACLADHACDEIELFATFQPGHPVPPRVRLFVDFIAASRLNQSS